MLRLLLWFVLAVSLSLRLGLTHAQNELPGQIIEINTRLRAFVGKPHWLLVIRDVDHGQTLPYLFDVRKGLNYWSAFTGGRNYLILASKITGVVYNSRTNQYCKYVINNFCHLESRGRIIRGDIMHINITGILSANPSGYQCEVNRFATSDNLAIPSSCLPNKKEVV